MIKVFVLFIQHMVIYRWIMHFMLYAAKVNEADAFEHISIYTSLSLSLDIYIYIYICMCV